MKHDLKRNVRQVELNENENSCNSCGSMVKHGETIYFCKESSSLFCFKCKLKNCHVHNARYINGHHNHWCCSVVLINENSDICESE